MQTDTNFLFIAKGKSRKGLAGLSVYPLYHKLSRREKLTWQDWILVFGALPPVLAQCAEGAISLIELIVQEWD